MDDRHCRCIWRRYVLTDLSPGIRRAIIPVLESAAVRNGCYANQVGYQYTWLATKFDVGVRIMEFDVSSILEQIQAAANVSRTTNAPGLMSRIFGRILNRHPQQMDWEEEAKNAIRENFVRTVENVTLTVAQAVQFLHADFDLNDLKEPDPTWTNHWLSGASKVSPDDHERSAWWSRLLAGEIQQQGSYSLRALGVMDVLSTAEALLFLQLAKYVWTWNDETPFIIPPTDKSSLWKPNPGEWSMLIEAGLVTRPMMTMSVELKNGGIYRIALGTVVASLEPRENTNLKVGYHLLSEAGQQIWRLTEPEANSLYLDELVNEWSEKCRVDLVR